MNIEDIMLFCQSLKHVTTEVLWDNVLVFKVIGKMFCFVPMDEEDLKMNLKCDPDEAIELRERYSAVLEGYHMNKKHWNTVLINNSVRDDVIEIWIKNSYQLVLAKVAKSKKEQLGI